MPRGKSHNNRELIDAAFAILERIQPATVRSVCYQLFIQKLIPSMDKNSTNRVSKQLTDARESGSIPWDWIVDETRGVERQSTFANPEEFIKIARRSYRRDHWIFQPNRLLVCSEKGSVRGTLALVLEQFGVDFIVLHGYSSSTCIHDIATASRTDRRQWLLLYVGDWDPSGLHMSEVDLPDRIVRYGGEVKVKRVALTAGDTGNGLPSFSASTKQKDTRYQWFVNRYGHTCYELDALSPVVLRDRIKDEIEQLIVDREAWARSERCETLEQQSLATVLNEWTNAG